MYEKFFTFIEKAGLFISGLAVILMMVFTSFDVIARKIIDYSVPGLFELTSDYLMVPLAFLAISYVYVTGGHIRIELFTRFLPEAFIKVLDKVFNFCAAVLYFFMAYALFEKTIKCFQLDQTASSLLAYPLGPSYLVAAIGAAMLAVRLIQNVIFPESIKKVKRDYEEIINY